jgi:hypothetical protein
MEPRLNGGGLVVEHGVGHWWACKEEVDADRVTEAQKEDGIGE